VEGLVALKRAVGRARSAGLTSRSTPVARGTRRARREWACAGWGASKRAETKALRGDDVSCCGHCVAGRAVSDGCEDSSVGRGRMKDGWVEVDV